MISTCSTPVPDEVLGAYWAGDLGADAAHDVEEHLFSCSDCAARLDTLASITSAVTVLARRGRLSGVISRAVLNQLQRDGLHVRLYAVGPGESVPCAAFPGDDVVVISLRGDFSGTSAGMLTVTSSAADGPAGTLSDVPLVEVEREVLWATPAAVIRRYPSVRVALTLRAADGDRRMIGEYLLEHSELA